MNKVVFITGGGTGIGQGISIEFAKAGYDVAFSYRGSAQGAKETARAIESLGRRVLAVKADVSNVDEIHQMFERVITEFSWIDVFINNAGIT